MKFKPGVSAAWPTKTFLEKVKPEPFVRYNNPTDLSIRSLEIPAAMRFRHVYIAGASRFGKSTLLLNMIVQDMFNGEGVTVLDPKGDLADLVLNWVPPSRVDDCIFLDVKDPVPVNFMGWEGEDERQTLMADVNQTFMRFSNMAAGDQWGSILRWLIYTLTAARKVSFLDIYYFLTDPDRHNAIMKLVREHNVEHMYDDILRYWEFEFPKIGKPREGPILTRMSTFITSPPLKKLLGTPEGGVDIFRCMEERKILIVKLIGAGRSNGNDIGALITSKIQQAAFRRQEQPAEQRVPHYFYADEFQNFQTSDFDAILSEAGGFKLSLTLANQGLYQLDSRIKQSIFTNVTAARIAFHLNHEDVSNWRHLVPSNPDKIPGQASIDPQLLANLPPHHAFFKIGDQDGVITRTPEPLDAPVEAQRIFATYIKKATHKRYPTAPASSAKSDSNRSGDNASCNSSPVRHDEEHGINYDIIEAETRKGERKKALKVDRSKAKRH